MAAQLDKLPLDLCSGGAPRTSSHRVPLPAGSDAVHFPARVGHSCGAFFILLDHRLVAAQSVDAHQCCAQSFLGDVGLQLGFRRLGGMASVRYGACTPSGVEPSNGIGGFEITGAGLSTALTLQVG